MLQRSAVVSLRTCFFRLGRRVRGGVSRLCAGTLAVVMLVQPTAGALALATAVGVAMPPAAAVAAPIWTRYEQTSAKFAYTGTWTSESGSSYSGGSYKYTTKACAATTFTFTGTDAKWIATKGSCFGIASVTLDGRQQGNVDLFAASAHVYQQSAWTTSGLAPTQHNVRIAYTGTKNAKASGTRVDVDAFDVVGASSVDTTPPTTTCNADGVWRNVASVTVTFTATDAGTGVKATYYRLNSGATTTYTAPFAVTAEGQTPIAYWSVDNAGNVEATKTATIRIDRGAPLTTSTADSAWHSSPYRVSLNASDALSGISVTKFGIGAGALTTYTAPFNVTADGTNTVSYWSRDVATNREATKTAGIRIDADAPTTTCSADNLWHRTPVTVSLAAIDTRSGVAGTFYRVGAGATATYTAPFGVSAEGTSVVSYWSTDKVGNRETTKTANVKVHMQGPTTICSVDGAWHTTTITVTMSASDVVGGVKATYYRLGSGATTTYTAPFPLSAEGQTPVRYWSVDTSGYAETTKTATAKIDLMAPVTSSDAIASYVGTATVHLDATDSVSGVAATYYSFDGGLTRGSGAVVTTTTPGSYILTYWSVDVAGNIEPYHQAPFMVAAVRPIPTITASFAPSTLLLGQQGTLSWSAPFADHVLIEPGLGLFGPVGSLALSPTSDTVYALTASNLSGVATTTVTAHVDAPPAASISADTTSGPIPLAVRFDGSGSGDPDGSIASWAWDFGDGTTATGSVVAHTYSHAGAYAAALTVTDNEGATSTARVAIRAFVPLPAATLTANPSYVHLGDPATLTWDTAFADTVTISGLGPVTATGTAMVFPVVDTTYTLTATNASGVATASAVVHVTNTQPLPDNTFGKQYEDLIPADATIGSYDATRFAVVTGIVEDVAQAPLAGVRVSVPAHPEYGSAETAGDGRFALPMEGGSDRLLQFDKDGYLSVQRVVNVPWNDIATCDTVLLTPRSPVVKQITLSGDPSQVETFTSPLVDDERGQRNTTLVLRDDTHAYATGSDGVERQVSTLAVRGSECTTEAALPGELPKTSMFTYCVDLSADGYSSVRFDQPVLTFTKNFLGFPVGTPVPAGYYDYRTQAWVPYDDGVIVRLLDQNADGVVDALDTNDDGLPDRVLSDETTSAQVAGLQDPSRFAPGDTYWCVPMTHFSWQDLNYPIWIPSDVEAPNWGPAQDGTTKSIGCPLGKISGFSTVDDREQVLDEDVPVAGTGLALHYSSERIDSRQTRISVPVSGPHVPASVTAMNVSVDVAGRHFGQSMPPQPNAKAEFVWDGTDALGRRVAGTANARVDVTYTYPVQFAAPASGGFRSTFAIPGALALPMGAGVPWRPLWLVSAKGNLKIDRPVDSHDELGRGWSLTAHHAVDSKDPEYMARGDGSKLERNVGFIKTLFGGRAQLAVDSRGVIYVSGGDYGTGGLYRVDPVTNAWTWVPIPGLPMYTTPDVYCVDRDDNLYLGVPGHLYRRSPSGQLTVVAGTGSTSGEVVPGELATASPVGSAGAAVNRQGEVFIADYWRSTVWKVDGSGRISRFAGNGTVGSSGDGASAVNAQLNGPFSLAADDFGNVFIATNNGIRKVDSSGIISTFSQYSGSIAVDAAGFLYVPLFTGQVVLRLDRSGSASVFAGGGNASDNCPATSAQVLWPTRIAVGPDGVYFSGNSYAGGGYVDRVSFGNFGARRQSGGDLQVNDENGQAYVFGADGRHKRTMDLNTGSTLATFSYDASGALSATTDRFGAAATIQRDENGRPVSITSPDGEVTSLTVDASGNLAGVGYADGSSYGFTYDATGLLMAKRDPVNHASTYRYDQNGTVNHVEAEDGAAFDFSRAMNGDGNLVSTVRSAEGNTTTYVDKSWQDGSSAATVTNPAGSSQTFSQTAAGMSAVRDLPGKVHQTYTYGWDDFTGQKTLTQMSTSMKSGLTMTLDRARTYADTNGDGIKDRITEVNTLNGRAATVTVDTLAGRVLATSPAGRAAESVYDTATLLTRTVTAGGLLPAGFAYDARGRMTSVTVGERTSTFTYDARGRLATATGPDGKTVGYAYDSVGRPVAVTRPDGSQLAYRYDAAGNVTQLVTPAGAVSTFTPTVSSARASWTPPDGGTYRYTYDKERKLKSVTAPSGTTVTNTYTHGFLTSVDAPDLSVTLVRGSCGKLFGAARGSETASFTYDGSLLTRDVRAGAMPATLSLTYDTDFRPASFSYAGATDAYTYDPDGLLTRAGAYTITRDAQSGLPLSVNTTDTSLMRAFTGYGNLASTTLTVAGTEAYAYSLTRDVSGRITGRTEGTGASAHTWSYTYDALGRLGSVTRDGSLAESYSYDANGNRTAERVPLCGIDDTATSTFDAADRITASSLATFATDVDGRVTSKTTAAGTAVYHYSSAGELTGADLPDGRRLTYTLDAFGRRTSRSIDGAVTDRYLWGESAHLLAVYNADLTLRYRFRYADSRVPVAVETSSGVFTLASDQTGSLRAIVASDGTPLREITRDSFGAPVSDTNPGLDIGLGFAGGLADADTGLTHFGAREYDPELGRFTTRDPIDFAGGDTNLYGYCVGDPVNFSDPEGLIGAAGLAVIGAITEGAGAAFLYVGTASAVVGLATLVYSGYQSWQLHQVIEQNRANALMWKEMARQASLSGDDIKACKLEREAEVTLYNLAKLDSQNILEFTGDAWKNGMGWWIKLIGFY